MTRRRYKPWVMTASSTLKQQDQKWKNRNYKLQDLPDLCQFYKQQQTNNKKKTNKQTNKTNRQKKKKNDMKQQTSKKKRRYESRKMVLNQVQAVKIKLENGKNIFRVQGIAIN